jgi:hypothetical protein
MKEINHHSLDLPQIKALGKRPDLEVWDDTPDQGKPPHVTLYVEDETRYINLTVLEARALAALLLNAADHQERRGS